MLELFGKISIVLVVWVASFWVMLWMLQGTCMLPYVPLPKVCEAAK